MNIGIFTYVTGVATLLGLFLQFRDIFPTHRDARKTIVLIIVGVFFGTLVGTLQQVSFSIAAPISGFFLLVAALLLILLIALISAIFSPDEKRRGELYGVFGGTCVVLVVVLLFGSLFASGLPEERQRKSLSVDELIYLSETNSVKGNYDRAVYWLECMKGELAQHDPRRKAIEERILQLKHTQIAPTEKGPVK